MVLWLLRWLVFRIMFLSGVVKLTSGDPTWRAWEALRYHYETQPLPTWTSWYLHQAPGWFHAASMGFMFWAELIAPFFVFGPRRVRMVGFWSLVLLQVLIAATGNYGFFNLLSIVLCLTLVEDRDWGRRYADGDALPPRRWWHRAVLATAGVIIVAVTTMEGLDRAGSTIVYPAPLEAVRRWVAPFHSMNSYGLFAVMTTERPEIDRPGKRRRGQLEVRIRSGGSRAIWAVGRGSALRTCPGWTGRCGSRRSPATAGPRAGSSPSSAGCSKARPKCSGSCGRIRSPSKPPRYVRARLFLYRFTGRGAEAWWQREDVGMFCPPAEL